MSDQDALIPAVPTTDETPPPRARARGGFACMTPERRCAIASLGGKASHAQGTGHRWTPEEARSAGRKGGQVSRGGKGKVVT